MREIKYRAWDKKSKKMRQVVEIVFNTGFYLEPNDNTVKLIWVKGYDVIEQKDIMMKREKDFELMQYTGLKDKNGKEIYEGDIVKTFKGEICIVEYNYNGFGLKVIDKSKPYGWVDFIEYQLEVIGNIYDNPELLGGE